MKYFTKNTLMIVPMVVAIVGAIAFNSIKEVTKPPVENKSYKASDSSINQPHNCRFWGMLTPGGFDDSSTMNHLKSLQQLASSNPNGWGFGFYTKTVNGGHIPVVYRGMWRADQDFLFDSAARIMLDNFSFSAIAHIRNSSSGYVNIPNPHPFYTKSIHRDFSMFFAHNGTLDKPTLVSMLGSYTNANHYQYSGNGANDPNLDSDLYRLFLMKWIDEHPNNGINACLVDALDTLTKQMGFNFSYNFIMNSPGDTLWALCYNNTLSYRRQNQPQGYLWEVASQPLSESDWTRATNHYLYIFSVNQPSPDSIQIKNEAYSIPENTDNIAGLNLRFKNPTTENELFIFIDATENRLVTLQIIGFQGQIMIKKSDFAVQQGENRFLFETGNLNAGIYFVRILAGQSSQTKKLIIAD